MRRRSLLLAILGVALFFGLVASSETNLVVAHQPFTAEQVPKPTPTPDK